MTEESPNVDAKFLVKSLMRIMCSTTTTAIDKKIENNDYFKRRVLGFRPEYDFERYFKNRAGDSSPIKDSGCRFIDGGCLIYSNQTSKQIYVTVSDLDPSEDRDVKEIFTKLSGGKIFSGLYFLQISCLDGKKTRSWETRKEQGAEIEALEILKQEYTCFQFVDDNFSKIENGIETIVGHLGEANKKKPVYHMRGMELFSFLHDVEIDFLKKVYARRFFLNVVLRSCSSNSVIDIDGFIKCPNRFMIAEIKQKSPIGADIDPINNNQKWQYGWDSRRLAWFMWMERLFGLTTLYAIQRVNNREERKIEGWDFAFMEDFLNGVNWSVPGGGGGGQETLIAPYSVFNQELADCLQPKRR